MALEPKCVLWHGALVRNLQVSIEPEVGGMLSGQLSVIDPIPRNFCVDLQLQKNIRKHL